MLRRALVGATTQVTEDRFSFEVIIVDNDSMRSAENVVKAFQEHSDKNIFYDCEPERNISLARNRCIKNATGNFIAFLDDDEISEATWLQNLFSAYKKFSVDGVLGPVIPSYEGEPPDWLVKSGLCERPLFRTGTKLVNTKYMRTGNVLLGRCIFDALGTHFDPNMGRTGGEDADFFERMLLKDRKFIWCNEARVFETVPVARQKLGYYIKRAFIRGVTSADQEKFLSLKTIKSLTAVILYTALLPFLLMLGYHFFVKYLIKDCDHTAKLLAHCGIKLIQERNF